MFHVQGRFVTFMPPAGAAYLIGDFTDWDERPLPVTGPMTLEFPAGAYVEYAFMDANKQPMADPTNAQVPRNPWYDYHRFITLPDNNFKTSPRPHIFRRSTFAHTLTSQIFKSQRIYYVYEPPVAPAVTVYVQDGAAYYQKLHFHEVAEALVEQGVILPVRLIFVEPQDRKAEYWFNLSYEAFLLEEILPAIESRYGPTPARGLWGASLGGLVSAWLAWRNPHVFMYIGSQSGCFTADPQGGDYYHDREWLTEQFVVTSRKPLRFHVQTGQIEWLLAPNRRFAAMLADKGYFHSYQELLGGHNWATWEQGLEPGLVYLFGKT
jgi:enterochelin esterase-like enzyme